MVDQTKLALGVDLKTLKAIDLYLEEIYPDSKNAGNEMARVDLGNAQIHGLETLITSVTRFSEIINYIKNQAGKEKEKERKWTQVAPLLLGQLEQLEERAERMGNADPATILDIKMRLARGWAKQVVAHCLYAKPHQGKGGR